MILLTGGSGVLGTELRRQFDPINLCRFSKEVVFPGSQYLDITKRICYQFEKSDLIIHCAAFTDLVRAEKEKELCYRINVLGTRNVVNLGVPIVYISTEYVFDGLKGDYEEMDYPNPQNFYSLTKLLGEYEAKKAVRCVIIRCLFKSRPFEHDFACIDKITSGDYVDVIAKDIILAIRNFESLPETIHIGLERKSMFELASQTRIVKPITVKDITTVNIPIDTSLNCNKWNTLKRSWK